MPELLDEIIDETAVFMNDLSLIRRQLKQGAKITDAQLAKMKREAARIVNLLQAVEVKQQEN